MQQLNLKAVVEGILFVSGDTGITLKQLSNVLDITEKNIEELLKELTADYEDESRGMLIIQADKAYYLTTKPEHSSYLKKVLEIPQTSKLSQAALESLAIIAYKQPITRVEIEEVRGVNSDRPVQTLLARSLIEEVGRRDTIGRPILFGTGKDFLTYFGLTSLDELPPFPETVDKKGAEEEADLFFNQLNQVGEDTAISKE